MQDSLIEQVKRLAEAQKRHPVYGTANTVVAVNAGACFAIREQLELDAPALLAHMECMQAVVDAARKAKHYLEHRTTCKYLWDGVECDCGYIAASAALAALRSLDTKAGG